MKIRKHIPNILSSSRLLSPVVLIPLILSGNLLGAIIALSGFFLTDALDGFLARKWHVQSDLGAKIDVVADKTMLASLLIPLVVSNPLMIVTLLLEGLISLVNVSRKAKGGNPKTIQFGRVKMVVISLFVIFCYLNNLVLMPEFFFNTFFAITTIFQIGAVSKYIEKGLKENKSLSDSKCNQEIKSINKENEVNLEKSLQNEINYSFNKLSKEKDDLLKLKEELLNLKHESELENYDCKKKVKVKN